MVAATAFPSSVVTADNNGMPTTWDRTAEWRADGWTCYRVNEESEDLTFSPSPTYDRYRIILKGGSKFWNGTFRRTIYNAQPGTTYAGEQDISHYVWCGKDTTPPPPPPPTGGSGDVSARLLGPKGDPWYRVVVKNFTDETVRVTWRYNGRDGIRKVRKSIPAGCVWKSGWHFVTGNTMTWVQDNTNRDRLFTRRSAPPGYYGPLYFGYRKGIHCG